MPGDSPSGESGDFGLRVQGLRFGVQCLRFKGLGLRT